MRLIYTHVKCRIDNNVHKKGKSSYSNILKRINVTRFYTFRNFSYPLRVTTTHFSGKHSLLFTWS